MKAGTRIEVKTDSKGLKVGTQAQIRPVFSSRMEKVKLMPAHHGRSKVSWS